MNQSIDISDCFFMKPSISKEESISTFIQQINDVKNLLHDFGYFFCFDSSSNLADKDDERYVLTLLRLTKNLSDKIDEILSHLFYLEKLNDKTEYIEKTYTSEILGPISVFTEMMEELNTLWAALHSKSDNDTDDGNTKNTIKTINNVLDRLISENSIELSTNEIENFKSNIKILNEENLFAIETPLDELLDAVSSCFPYEIVPIEIKNIVEKYLTVCNLNATISLLKNSHSTFKVNIMKAKTIQEEEENNYLEKVKTLQEQKIKEDSEKLPTLPKPFVLPAASTVIANRKSSLTTTSNIPFGKISDFPISFSKPPVINPEVLQLQEEKKMLAAKVKALEIDLQNAKDELESERMSAYELNERVNKSDELFAKIFDLEETLNEKDKAINKLTKELNKLTCSNNNSNENNNIFDYNDNDNNNLFNHVDLEENETIKNENRWLHKKIEEMEKRESANETGQVLSQALAKNAIYENKLSSTNEMINDLRSENLLLKAKSEKEKELENKVKEQDAIIKKLKSIKAEELRTFEIKTKEQNERIEKLESEILLLKAQKTKLGNESNRDHVSSPRPIVQHSDEKRKIIKNSRQKIINLLITE